MIDHFALALGHGLLVIALLRLVLRDGLDDDPLIGDIQAKMASNRQSMSSAGRSAARRATADEPSGESSGAAPAAVHER